ncbi:MAG: response regulator transcription factor [Stenomitos rutilans HA7619-LM2]|jgi:DNA-binding NarL/FixJ family response regulator|nr:response regulator transcription factor [Stenomitos rutilans HA7619-LM2]
MNKIRIALIEDHDLTRLGLRLIFERYPEIEIVGEAADGTTGAMLLKTMNPDVAVLDLGLPGMSGIEVIRHYKKTLDTASNQTKFMVLTLQEEAQTVLAAVAAGADSYCLKNLPGEQLVEALQSTYQGDSWLDPTITRLILDRQRTVAITAASKSGQVNITADETQQAVLESYPLTRRELEILGMIVDGASNAYIAETCYITIGTVKTHVRNILNKLSVDDRTQAAVRALRAGLVA